jgi:hypothetical protein
VFVKTICRRFFDAALAAALGQNIIWLTPIKAIVAPSTSGQSGRFPSLKCRDDPVEDQDKAADDRVLQPSSDDLAVGQRILESGNAFIGDLRFSQTENG